jgi:Tfp pilus assembly protein PilO
MAGFFSGLWDGLIQIVVSLLVYVLFVGVVGLAIIGAYRGICAYLAHREAVAKLEAERVAELVQLRRQKDSMERELSTLRSQNRDLRKQIEDHKKDQIKPPEVEIKDLAKQFVL